MASTFNLDKNKYYLVSEITQLGPTGIGGMTGAPGPVYEGGRYIEINQNRIINANLETGTYLKIVGNILSSNLIADTNMTLTRNIISSNITSNINLNNSVLLTSINDGNIRFRANLDGAVDIITNNNGSTITTSNNLLKLISIFPNVYPTLELYKNSISPAASDLNGTLNFTCNTTTLSKRNYVTGLYVSAYPSVTNMSGAFNLLNWAPGGFHLLHLNASNIGTNQINHNYGGAISTSTGTLLLQNYRQDAAVQLNFYSNATSEIARTSYISFNSTGAAREYARIYESIVNNTSGGENGLFGLNVLRNGTLSEFMRLNSSGGQASLIFNNSNLDTDFIYRSWSLNLIICDAALNSVAINTTVTSADKLRVAGNITTNTATIPNIIVGTGTGTANLIIMSANRSTTAGSLAAYLNIIVNGVNRKIPLYNP